MVTKYFILDVKQKTKEVPKDVHSVWAETNAEKYNRSWKREDGTKSISLTFKGTKEANEDLVLFSVHSVFSGYDGEVINDFDDEFDNYEDAKEHYEMNLYNSGGE